MKKPRASSFALSAGLALALAWGITPALTLAQDPPPIIGDWSGTLNPGAQPKKRIVVHISAAQDGSLSGTIDYPDQDTSGIQMTAITFKAHALHFESSSIPAIYDGTMDQRHSLITGTWKQGVAPL